MFRYYFPLIFKPIGVLPVSYIHSSSTLESCFVWSCPLFSSLSIRIDCLCRLSVSISNITILLWLSVSTHQACDIVSSYFLSRLLSHKIETINHHYSTVSLIADTGRLFCFTEKVRTRGQSSHHSVNRLECLFHLLLLYFFLFLLGRQRRYKVQFLVFQASSVTVREC